MRSIKWFLLLIILVTMSYSVNYREIDNVISIADAEDIVANRLIPITVGIKGLGMGKLGVAQKTSNSIFVNPAVAASLDKTMVSGGGRLHLGTISDGYSDANADSYDAKYKPHVKFTHVSGVVPFKLAEFPISIGTGVGYHTLYDFGENYYFSRESGGDTEEKTLKIHGGLNLISPSLSLGFFDKVFVGITVNASILGKISAEEEVGGELSDPEEFDGSGVYAILGIFTKPIEPLAIGLSYWPKFEWKFERGKYISIPQVIALGAQYQITDQLLAGLEAQTRLYKQLETRPDGEMKNGVAVRLGGEYAFETIALRLGAFGETVPIGNYDYDLDTEKDEPTFAFGGTGGASININNVNIDLGLSWTRYSHEQSRTNLSTTELETFDYSENHIRVDAGITINLPGIGFQKENELEPVVQDTTMPEPIPEPERRKPVY